jgi:inorganic triphosphatase YgiF
MAGPHLEIEAKLAVTSDAPHVVADEIAGLESLENWTLRERNSVLVRDVYVDAPNLPLEESGVALRLRLVENRYVVTLKGRETRIGNALQREELEREWSRETLDLISSRLRDWGIRLSQPPSFGDESEPSAVIAHWGLVAVQDRETFRRCKDVVPGSSGGAVAAELAVDEVVYRIAGRRIRHHEVEIELHGSEKTAALADIVADLCCRWPVLTVWPHSKYATGKALEALLAVPQATLEISESGDLLPAGYAGVERWLGERRR